MESETKEKTEINENYKKETLCSNNLQVQFNLKQLKKFLKDKRYNTEDIQKILSNSIAILKYMKKQGQKLENRCRKYLYAIEGCGFVRVKRQRREVENFISRNKY